LGFVFRVDNPDRAKRYFREAPGAPRTHVHVRRAGSWGEQFPLLFRDYLRHNEYDARSYEALKRALAKKHRDDRSSYTDGKGPFIWEIMQRADRWTHLVGWEAGPSDA
jgi:GrpB-like predicted nucleotidyltransferase (UPF0157 family)